MKKACAIALAVTSGCYSLPYHSTEDLAQTNLPAAEWVKIDSSPDGTIEIQPDRLSRGRTYLTAWTRTSYSAPKHVIKTLQRAGYDYQSVLRESRYKCPDGSAAQVSAVYFAPDGSRTDSFQTNSPEFAKVIPSTEGEALLLSVCRYIREHPEKVK